MSTHQLIFSFPRSGQAKEYYLYIQSKLLCFIWRCTQHISFTVIWHQTYVKDHSDSERGNLLLTHWLLFPISSKGSFMHHPTDRITHTTAFVTPVMEHWLEREIAQLVHHCTMSEHTYHRATSCSLAKWKQIYKIKCQSFINTVSSNPVKD